MTWRGSADSTVIRRFDLDPGRPRRVGTTWPNNWSTTNVQNSRCFRRLDLPWQPGRLGRRESDHRAGAKLTVLAGGFEFTEGPAADAQGNVFFTDQPNDRIMKWSTDGKLTTFMKPCGRSNGLCFDAQGNLWACADEKNEMWRIDPAGKVTVVVKDYQGKLLNGPNDVWLRPDGGLYFTDPYYQRPYWKRGPKEIEDRGRFTT